MVTAVDLMAPYVTRAVLIGMGSGVTAPLGLLSFFCSCKPMSWVAFIFR